MWPKHLDPDKAPVVHEKGIPLLEVPIFPYQDGNFLVLSFRAKVGTKFSFATYMGYFIF